MTSKGRFTEQAMRDSLTRIANKLAIDAFDARLLRLTNNAVFLLPSLGLVVRITRTRRLQARVHKVAALGGWFSTVNAPTIRLADHIDQPVTDGDLLATVWQYVPPTSPRPSAADLGTALRAFHRLGLPPFEIPAWDPVGDARTRIADAEALADEDRSYLLTWCDRLQPQIDQLIRSAETGLLHGDAHEGNLIRQADGRVLLCDFDATSMGPLQADLVPASVNEARFDRSGGHKELAAAYGYDVRADRYWPLLREARELKMIAAGVPLLASAPGVADEFRHRLDSIREGNSTARWRAFGDLPR